MSVTASGHKCIREETIFKLEEDWLGYRNGVVRLTPGRWLYPTAYTKFADKYFNLKACSTAVDQETDCVTVVLRICRRSVRKFSSHEEVNNTITCSIRLTNNETCPGYADPMATKSVTMELPIQAERRGGEFVAQVRHDVGAGDCVDDEEQSRPEPSLDSLVHL
nr:uncharacterized protein LOC128690894 [Cherax quadricarinatus]